ncbi:MAG: single-stranded-DNA-specific exonuclease RecJ [Tenericutes bacterium]|nr:single-stranded-DNA-specific exonuclease RecJ [Mycoplasmatota bacterium]
MLKSKYVWKTKVDGLVPNDEIFTTILKNRDIDDYKSYFSLGGESLIDPYKLNDMQVARDRIFLAIERKEKIIVFGDYDCDGICSISLLYRSLKQLDADVYYDLPNRFRDGYGLNMRAVEEIKEAGIKLVITVDNGVSCIKEVAALNEAGIDTIITDHHEFGDTLPSALAILHTQLSDAYEFKDIAGVMVAFKLAQALIGEKANEYYDLAMIGTLADLMPLKNENQAMVNLGLKQMKNTTNLGLKKLIEFSNLDIINVTAISFKIAPKINSSGRLGKALEAVKLLVADEYKDVNELILKIEKNHASRKKFTEESFKLCEQFVNADDQVIVIAHEGLHEGVIGICAQKIVEKYQRSALILTLDSEGIGKGSMRSFGDQNILDMLHANKEYLLRYGGHSQAAGLQIKEENIDALKIGLNSMSFDGVDPVLNCDMALDLCNIKIDTIQKIQDHSFFTAMYLFNGLVVSKKQILGGKHTKLILDCHGMKFDALHFNSLEYYHSLENGDHINVVAGLNVNNYRNQKKIQLMIKDVSCPNLQVLDMRESKDYNNDVKWVFNDFWEINDSILLENDLETLIMDHYNTKTIIIGPKKTKINLNKLVYKPELGKIYQMLKEIHEFKLDLLLRRLEYDKLILKYAIKIFFELDLIYKQEDFYVVREDALKTDLQNSPTYVKLEGVKKQLDFLYQDYVSHIRTYFKKQMEE